MNGRDHLVAETERDLLKPKKILLFIYGPNGELVGGAVSITKYKFNSESNILSYTREDGNFDQTNISGDWRFAVSCYY